MRSVVLLTILSLISVSAYPSSPRGRERRGTSVIDVLSQDRRFSKFLDSLSRNRGLADDLDDPRQEVTVFAPTNEAYERAREELQGRRPRADAEDIWRYHFTPLFADSVSLRRVKLLPTQLQLRSLNGEEQKIRVVNRNNKIYLNGEVLLQDTDIEADNGIVHAVDEILFPPASSSEILFKRPYQFSTLSSALQITNLERLLDAEDGVTVFAPTNTAFRKLGCRALQYLFSDLGQRDLRKIIEYHISPELVYSIDLKSYGRRRGGERGGEQDGDRRYRKLTDQGQDDVDTALWKGDDYEDRRDYPQQVVDLPTMLRGKYITVQLRNGHYSRSNILVNNEANVVFSDTVAKNGVIHAIDELLIPDGIDIPELDFFDDEGMC
ncbi:beta-Ig-H3/fasciclin [Basidiobolus meristosporus CBS 931.73]|uniref:Beta-Ig-H3/fasciclin n=1 Tax=Basidiobolus meristosporus CBS 931.73 TaxID=1314790 RepID=A0A1Y1XDX1_9FUNG|nr:beta-Ig-H3/fasciclin [Basidiobolus meristosporus CBS 931.73]|eukprot:ORX83646.1 beta-Ig-H3/fasciclin [Basidiobolus meristosporus CBS 931.73]